MNEKTKNRRKYTRSEEGKGTKCSLCFSSLDKAKFEPEYSAVLLEEAFDGCAIEVVYQGELTNGQKVLLCIGEQGPYESEIRYFKNITDGLFQIGFSFGLTPDEKR